MEIMKPTNDSASIVRKKGKSRVTPEARLEKIRAAQQRYYEKHRNEVIEKVKLWKEKKKAELQKQKVLAQSIEV